jgi:sterol desaturase/sphingolipid hydroxylase (fatty acid hydroxylase superfamily)
MSTDRVAAFVVGWAALVARAIATFTLLERARPRHREHPKLRRIAIAAGLLAVAAAIARTLAAVSDLPGGRVVLAWLVAELLHYVVHRAMHRVPALWHFHRVHHEPVPLAWTTAWYLHPVDSVLNASAAIAGAWLVGGGLPVALWFVVGRRVWSIVLHANLTWPASPLDGLVATPAFHAEHHREDLEPANFAATLSLLDPLFGTYRSSYASARATGVSLP